MIRFLALAGLLAADPIAAEAVEFESHGVTLAGELLLPEKSPAPAIVIVHGSGAADRSNPWTAAWAGAMAARGVAVLHVDKRGCGRSRGDWKTASFDVLADDAVAAVQLLKRHPRIDPKRIGLAGFSQGGHVVPIAAARSSDVAFAIAISSSVVPLVEQTNDEIEAAIEKAGLDEASARAVLEVQRLAVAFARSGNGYEEYSKALDAAKRGRLAGHPLVAGFPTERDHWVFAWGRAVGNPDPIDSWKKVRIPALFVFGGKDSQVRVDKSLRRIREALDSPKPSYSVVVCAANGHALFREDVADFAARWIREPE